MCGRSRHSQAYLASGQSASDPQKVQGFEGHQDEADVGCQVLGTLGVHEVVCGVAPRVLLIADRGSQVDPDGQKDRGTDGPEPFRPGGRPSRMDRRTLRPTQVVLRRAELLLLLLLHPHL